MNTQERTGKDEGKNILTLGIQPPRAEKKVYNFPKTAKVAEVIAVAVGDPALRLDPKGTYYLTTPGPEPKVMDAQRPLVSYGLKDGDVLTITADGAGV